MAGSWGSLSGPHCLCFSEVRGGSLQLAMTCLDNNGPRIVFLFCLPPISCMELDPTCLLDADGAADPGEMDTRSLALFSSPFCVSWVCWAVGDEAGIYGGILWLTGMVTGWKQGSTVHPFSAPVTRG